MTQADPVRHFGQDKLSLFPFSNSSNSSVGSLPSRPHYVSKMPTFLFF